MIAEAWRSLRRGATADLVLRSDHAGVIRWDGDGKRLYAISFLPKAKLEVVIADNQLDQAMEAISKTAQTGNIGDGKIFVMDVAQAVRIRTGEKGDAAM